MIFYYFYQDYKKEYYVSKVQYNIDYEKLAEIVSRLESNCVIKLSNYPEKVFHDRDDEIIELYSPLVVGLKKILDEKGNNNTDSIDFLINCHNKISTLSLDNYFDDELERLCEEINHFTYFRANIYNEPKKLKSLVCQFKQLTNDKKINARRYEESLYYSEIESVFNFKHLKTVTLDCFLSAIELFGSDCIEPLCSSELKRMIHHNNYLRKHQEKRNVKRWPTF